MTAPTEIVLSLAELSAVLRLAGVAPGPGSPLRKVPSWYAPSLDTFKALTARGLTDAQGRLTSPVLDAVPALAQPDSKLVVSTVLPPGRISRAEYYTGGSLTLSYAADAGESRTISYPVMADRVAAAVCRSMDTASLLDGASFADVLAHDEFSAFAALVDAYHEARAIALINRQRHDRDWFDLECLRRQLTTGRDTADLRWLTGLIAAAGSGSIRVDPEAVSAGLPRLRARGWIAVHDGGARILTPLAPLCRGLTGLLPSVSSSLSTGDRQSSMLAIRGRDAFWTIEADTAHADIRMTAMNGPELERFMARHLGALGPPRTSQVPAP